MVEKLSVGHLSPNELIRFNQNHQQRVAHFPESVLKQFRQNS